MLQPNTTQYTFTLTLVPSLLTNWCHSLLDTWILALQTHTLFSHSSLSWIIILVWKLPLLHQDPLLGWSMLHVFSVLFKSIMLSELWMKWLCYGCSVHHQSTGYTQGVFFLILPQHFCHLMNFSWHTSKPVSRGNGDLRFSQYITAEC